MSAQPAPGQDATHADPRHYRIAAENDKVRVLRATYKPGETSVMHGHPAFVAVMLTSGKMRFSFPDGTSQEISAKAGEVMALPHAQEHLLENIGAETVEVILLELKS